MDKIGLVVLGIIPLVMYSIGGIYQYKDKKTKTK